jgi:Ty3 transposon capsid-like protein
LNDRFNPDSKNPVGEFKRIHQLGKVDEYINSYERIRARVSARQYSDEEFYVLGFLSGLKDEIANTVLLYNPVTLKHAYKLARQIEKSLSSQTRMLKLSYKQFSSSSFTSLPFKSEKLDITSSDSSKPLSVPNTKSLTLDQKKSLGLCFRCGDKFFLGHKCKLKGIHILEENDSPELDDIVYTDSLLDDNTQTTIDQPLITMCTSSIPFLHKTLKFQGQIRETAIIAMLDSGSSHSFINPSLVASLSLPTCRHPKLTIWMTLSKISNHVRADKIFSNFIISSLKLALNGVILSIFPKVMHQYIFLLTLDSMKIFVRTSRYDESHPQKK